MIKNFDKKLTSKDVIASPKDEILNGVIIKIEQGLLRDFLDPAVHSKFDNLEQETLRIEFEVKFNGTIIKGADRIAYYDIPMANSKLGQFLSKYEKIEVGQPIKVIYDAKGFGKIKVD